MNIAAMRRNHPLNCILRLPLCLNSVSSVTKIAVAEDVKHPG
jgi:hypothetical protein